jgi:hypothetical protein
MGLKFWEPQWLGFQPLMTDSGDQDKHMAGQVHFLHSPAIAQITLSSYKLYLLFSETDCFHVLWIVTLLQIFNAFYAPRKYLYCIKIKLSCFLWCFRLFHSFYVVKFLEPNRRFMMKINYICDCFQSQFITHIKTQTAAPLLGWLLGYDLICSNTASNGKHDLAVLSISWIYWRCKRSF